MSRPPQDGEGGDFLARWSRRKRAAAAPQEPEPQPAPAPEKSDAEILAELGLPDPDSLMPGDDVRGFMVRAVPAHLRNRALRRLWTSNPVLACLDGLNDYDEDYTLASSAGQAVQTLYRVGKGFVTHEEEAAARAAALPQGAQTAEPDAAAAPPAGTGESPAGGDGDADRDRAGREAPPTPLVADADAPTEAAPAREPAPMPRRRMRFATPGGDGTA